MPFFLEVVLPLPLKNSYTYQITQAESAVIVPGMRIVVPVTKAIPSVFFDLDLSGIANDMLTSSLIHM